MPHFSQVSTVLRVPINNFSALTTGVSLVAISRSFIREGQQFVLVESGFNADSEESTIAYWASCVSSQVIEECHDIDYLSKITHLSVDQVQKKLEENSTFLAFLRVYQIPIKIQQSLQFNRQFAALTAPIAVVDEFPLISQQAFEKRKKQIQDCTPSEHPDLEALQNTIATYLQTEHIFKEINHDLKCLLGWDDYKDKLSSIENLKWIETINELGDRSKEIEGKLKNNWQAGTDFEHIVKQSLEFLGFGIDETHRGGSGGLDFFCSTPYPLTGECKCGKKIPSGTTEELIKLGGMRLPSADDFLASAKIIIGPGHPNPDVITAAQKWRVSIIKPMTLQKLAEIHNRFPIDLIELKKYLKPGQIDDEIDIYIELHLAEIAIRSHVVKTFKQYLEKTKSSESGVEKFSGFFCNSNAPQHLEDRELHEILIELSSPLTGYLGRTKGNTWKDDRFYFLRDLIV